MVIIPDYYRGTCCNITTPFDKRSKEDFEMLQAFIKKHSVWEGSLRDDWEKSIYPYAIQHGAESISTIGKKIMFYKFCSKTRKPFPMDYFWLFSILGFCWGSYVVVKMSESPIIKAGVSMHPSHSKICEQIGENEELQLKNIKCPQLFLPAGNDHPNTKFGGAGKKVLGDALKIIEFSDMTHGWSVRGDMADPVVERDVVKAFNFTLAFFKQYM